jgi:hypothetical protein
MLVMALANNPWLRLTQVEPYVLPEDRLVVSRWNSSLDPDDPRRVELHVLPEPFLGYHDAPLVLLMANPGSVARDRRIDRSWLTAANQEALTTLGGTPVYSLDDRAARFPGGIWWREATRGLLAPGRTYSDLARKILVVQYHGYHSGRPSLPPEPMPSQDFAISLVTSAMDRGAAIIIGTASGFWRSRVPGLASYRSLATKNSPQSKSLGPGNLGSRFSLVAAALSR